MDAGNLDPLQEHQALLTAKPSLQSIWFFFYASGPLGEPWHFLSHLSFSSMFGFLKRPRSTMRSDSLRGVGYLGREVSSLVYAPRIGDPGEFSDRWHV